MLAAAAHVREVAPLRHGQQARLVRPVLEHATLPAQLVDAVVGQPAEPRGERQPVRPVDRRDRVDLHHAEPLDRRLDLGHRRRPRAGREALAVDGDAPRGRRAQLEHGPSHFRRSGSRW